MGCAPSANPRKLLSTNPEKTGVSPGLTVGSNVEPENQPTAPLVDGAPCQGPIAVEDSDATSTGSFTLPLERRAVHIRFLRAMANLHNKVDGKSVRFGEVPIYQAVNNFVRPRTSAGRNSFMGAVVSGDVDLRGGEEHCEQQGLGGGPIICAEPSPDSAQAAPADSTTGVRASSQRHRQRLPLVPELTECGRDRLGKGAEASGPVACGPVTFFVSYAWSYTLDRLVSMVERHYRKLPGAMVVEGLFDSSEVEYYIPVYYWVDVFAVTQHFKGDFKDHPDSNFPGVIRASQAVLFTLYPLDRPITFTRVWCLFEAMTAIQDHIRLEMTLDDEHGYLPPSGPEVKDEDGTSGGDAAQHREGGASAASGPEMQGQEEARVSGALGIQDCVQSGGSAGGEGSLDVLPSALAPDGVLRFSFCESRGLQPGFGDGVLGSAAGDGSRPPKDLQAVFAADMEAFGKKHDATAAIRRTYPTDDGPAEERDAVIDELIAAVVALASPAAQAAAQGWRLAQGLDGTGSNNDNGSESQASEEGKIRGRRHSSTEEVVENDDDMTQRGSGGEGSSSSDDYNAVIGRLTAALKQLEDSNGVVHAENESDGSSTTTTATTASSSSSSLDSSFTRRRANWPVSRMSAEAAVSNLDVQRAQATVQSDYDFILGLIRDGLGVERFNAVLQQQLRLRFLEQLLVQAWCAGDCNAAGLLIREGARCLSPVLAIEFPSGTAARRCASSLLAALLDHSSGAAVGGEEGSDNDHVKIDDLSASRSADGVRDLKLTCKDHTSWRCSHDGDVVAFVMAEALAGLAARPPVAAATQSENEERKKLAAVAPPAVGVSNARNSAEVSDGAPCARTDKPPVAASSIELLSLSLPMGPLGCMALGEALRVNTSLSTLSLGGYFWNEACLMPLFGALAQGNRGLRHLKMFGSNMGTSGAEALCSFIKVSPALEKLELINGGLTDPELAALVDAALVAGRLRYLNLFQNMLTPACAPTLERLLVCSSTLRVLNVGFNWIGAEGYAAVARGLSRNSVLQELHCKDLGPAGARALLETLRRPDSACRASLRVIATSR